MNHKKIITELIENEDYRSQLRVIVGQYMNDSANDQEKLSWVKWFNGIIRMDEDTLFSPDKARELRDELNGCRTEHWSYTVVLSDSEDDLCYVVAYNESGNRVGRL